MAHVCPICHDDSTVTYRGTHQEYDYLYCENCSLQYVDPMREPGAEFYDGSTGDTTLLPPVYDWRFASCFDLLKAEPGKQILDIGCGDGGFLAQARDRGYGTFGMDLDSQAIARAKQGRGLTNLRCGVWTDLAGFEGWKDFDVVTLFDVLEHVSDPLALVRLIHSVMCPGGQVCITVPRLDRYPRIFDPEADVPPHHLTLWTSAALTTLLEKAGFERIRVIMRPLVADNFVNHFVCRLKRIRSGAGCPQDGSQQNSLDLDSKGTDSNRSKRLIKGVLKGLFSIPTFVLRVTAIGRGYHLLVLAERCK